MSLPMRVMQCLCADQGRVSPISGARTQAKPAIVAGLVKCKRVSRPRPSHESPTKRAQRGRELRRLRLDADRRVPGREDGDVVVGHYTAFDAHRRANCWQRVSAAECGNWEHQVLGARCQMRNALRSFALEAV
jgi:hypothetical protein